MRAASILLVAALLAGVPAWGQQPPVPPVAATSAVLSADHLLPLMQEWRGGTGTLSLAATSTLALDPAAPADWTGEADQLAKDLAKVTGRTWQVVRRAAREGEVALRPTSAPLAAEGYRLSVDMKVTVEASAGAGLYYGGRTLLQWLLTAPDPAKALLPRGVGNDHPRYGRRVVMLDLGRRYFQMDSIKALIARMGFYKLNTLHLHFTDWPAFRLDSPRYPGLAPAGASYSREDVKQIEAWAAQHHITIVPEIDIPAHAVALTDYKPELGFKCPSMRSSHWLREAAPTIGDKAWTVDITRPENAEWLKGLLGEFIPWFSGPYFHVGGDEYQYDADKERCPELMEATKRMGLKYPGDVFIDWINQSNQVVKAHGKRTMIWSWWGFKDDKTSTLPDRDIIVEVWNQEMEAQIKKDGFDIILTPEDTMYVTPWEDINRNSNYGLFDLEKVYERYPHDTSPQVLGYALAIWADRAERHTDHYFLSRAEEPMLVMAERLWTGPARGSVWDLMRRADRIDTARRGLAER